MKTKRSEADGLRIYEGLGRKLDSTVTVPSAKTAIVKSD